MQSIRQVARLNEAELEKVVPPNASWHTDYRDTAYIYIGGLPFELSEGDILTIFSQYGNPTDVKLVRDRETGKSRGFAFLKYEDQRSCDLAVDNLSGGGVLGRVMSVDHTRYKKKDGEVETVGDEIDEGDETDREGASRGKRRRKSESGSDSDSEDERPRLREEVELAKLMAEHDADDPMKAYLIDQKKAEVQEALQAVAKKSVVKPKKHRHPHRRSEDDGRTKQRSPKSHGSRVDSERSREKHRGRRERSESSSSSHDDMHRRPR